MASNKYGTNPQALVSLGPIKPTRYRRPPLDEGGFPGSRQYAGRFTEEYLTDLIGDKWFQAVDRMRRSDGLVCAIEHAIELPIRSAEWTVQPAGGKKATGAAKEAAEFVSNNLFGGLETSWNSLLHQILLHVSYGFTVCEQIWTMRDGYVAWKDIAPRKPSTRWRWFLDESGHYAGWQQYGWMVDGFGFSDLIPAAKTLRFTYREEYGNFDGLSLFRSAYKHWFIRDASYQTFNLGMERNLLGIPTGHFPAGASAKAKADAAETLRNYTTGKQAWMMLPEGWEAEVTRGDGTFLDAMQYINHHGQMLVMTALADFLMLGHENVGSYALSSDKTSLFLLCLNAILKTIIDEFNRAIRQICGWNWPGMTEYPTLECSKLSGMDLAAISNALMQLANSGVVTPDVSIEEHMRNVMGLPEIPEHQMQARLKAEEAKSDDLTENPLGVQPDAGDGLEDPDAADEGDEAKKGSEAKGKAEMSDLRRRRIQRFAEALRA